MKDILTEKEDIREKKRRERRNRQRMGGISKGKEET